ncbi:uncharacterized protein LOC111338901 isoform X2 [Stylophora pistillata]|nr:uncharacterized protein LOC111338901 isoform X2 [Stylophora pistillata]XP_022801204.1 uncharacterized protein LOC111338901 isoform X2 [Stylophora pistillata]XP_022801213.1 uncharacterized protein LOC111338901 isoform X2 [Stylophora pistillata]
MIAAPKKPTKAYTGDTVSLRWHYNSGDLKDDLYEVVFGIWKSPGFLKTKLVAVNSSGFSLTRPSYESAVGWAGNLTSSMAVFELYNVKLEDSKKYGIVVEYGLQNTPLTGTVQLQVVSGLQAKLRHTGPPKTATTQQRNVTMAVMSTTYEPGSPETSKEPGVSVPSGESSFKLMVACGVILFGVITLIGVSLWFRRHTENTKCGAHHYSCCKPVKGLVDYQIVSF